MKHGWEIRIDAERDVVNPAEILRSLAASLDRGSESNDGLLNALSDGIERQCDTAWGEVWIVRTREDAVRQPATGDPTKPIVVTVSGGFAEVDLSTIPAGMSVEVRDYDNGRCFDPEHEDADEAGVEQDSDGKWYSVCEYCFDDRPESYPSAAGQTGEHRCDNCRQHFATEDLITPIPDLAERVDEDGPEPSGECPLCGALCYPIPEGE